MAELRPSLHVALPVLDPATSIPCSHWPTSFAGVSRQPCELCRGWHRNSGQDWAAAMRPSVPRPPGTLEHC